MKQKNLKRRAMGLDGKCTVDPLCISPHVCSSLTLPSVCCVPNGRGRRRLMLLFLAQFLGPLPAILYAIFLGLIP